MLTLLTLCRLSVKFCGKIHAISQLRHHAVDHLQAQILFVAQAVGAALDDADLVIEFFDEAARNFVLGSAVGSDAIPVMLDRLWLLISQPA